MTVKAYSGSRRIIVHKNVGEIIEQHVIYELECIDRMYLNGYIPKLQAGTAAVFIQKQVRLSKLSAILLIHIVGFMEFKLPAAALFSFDNVN